MEALEQQIKLKDNFERQLSMEKSQLERNITNSNKAAQRMSQNVEELQWRIKNNFELPVDFFQKPLATNEPPTSFQGFCEHLEKSVTSKGTNQNLQSTPLPIMKAESVMKQISCFDISPEMLQATCFDVNNSDTCENNGTISDFSPSSNEVIEYMIEGDSEEDPGEYHLDGDSQDEGLGDISSDETTESIVPNMGIVANHKSYNNEICEQAKIISAKSLDKNIIQNYENIETPSRPKMNEKERRPSRISFETPL
eukprot:TRINITY_DN8021_c0_g1_i2.p1 TRINITY_DN8021_c0_g1~~TRINITY_DN8021_c0_g1_i2.p1  ORF type:complete len:298 (-),score=81.18 TRINITY_DN8021_c0_g1_i2:114-875(-)